MDQRYTLTDPTDHQPYHADLKTAQLLQDLKVRSRETYDLVATYMKSEGRLQPGIAPRADAVADVPHKPGLQHDPGPAPIEPPSDVEVKPRQGLHLDFTPQVW